MKMTMMMPGWSAHGGQTVSPYVKVIEENEKILGHSVRNLNILFKLPILSHHTLTSFSF